MSAKLLSLAKEKRSGEERKGGLIERERKGKEMGFIGKANESIRSIAIRCLITQAINLGMLMASALMIWKLWICLIGSESPAVVVLSGSMEPGFRRGDMLFLHMNKLPIRSGEIVVFNVDGRDIPIVHRVIEVDEQRDTGEVYFLTKGDNNSIDDRNGIYANGQLWLQQHHIIGRVIGILPYAGWPTIIMSEKPIIKYLLKGVKVKLTSIM